MDPLILTLTIACSILGVLLAVLAIQAFLTLREARQTLKRINGIVDVLEHTALRTLIPLTNLGGFIGGMKTGVKMFESFVHFLQRNSDE